MSENRPCDNPAMRLDDRFDDLLASLAGFHRSWLVALGLEGGLFRALRDAGEQGLTPAALPQLTADLASGERRVVDVHCGGGRWLIAMARRYPGLRLVGVEFEPDSVARA